MSSQLINIEKFSGKSNFSLWRSKIRALLKQQGIWTPIAGTKPDDMTDANYKLQEEKTHSTILLCLSDEVLYELLLKQRLLSLRMNGGSSFKEHLDALNSILMDLKNVEVKIEDEDATLILLVSLPPSFESFVSSFVVGKDTITLEDVRSSLHSRELRQQASGSGYESQSMGLSTTSRDRGRYRFEKGKNKGGASSSSQGPNPRDICNYCKETGHWKIDCPKLKEKTLVTATSKDDSCYSGSECDLL
ncbi:retrovirus-related pol polyprotein from transposon TNT 1-94 [Tanacetum coccineum]